MAEDFGTFEPIFGEGAPYLALLNLSSPDVPKVVARVIHLAQAAPEPYQEIEILLDDRNWRPHLVGAVALASLPYNQSALAKLWRAVDAGSWVTPQLVAIAYLRDPNFKHEALSRLQNLCPLNLESLLSMTPIERHSAAGPAGGRHRSAKTAASLRELLKNARDLTDQEIAVMESPEVKKLAEDDFDASGEIAREWLADIKELVTTP
jgi:hypothetical protein